VIALNDLMRQTFVVVGNTKKPLFFFLLACLIYLAASGISTWIALRLEARAGRGFVGSR
jgi:polar amino acid transport system permease protein